MKALFIALLFALSACSTTKCRSIDNKGKLRAGSDPEVAPVENPAAVTPTNSGVVTNEGLGGTPNAPPASDNSGGVTPNVATPPQSATTGEISTIKVYKYDNSRQCGQGKATELDEMAKQLKNVKIISQEKKNDGMMRIQMCGAPTGIANIYEIDRKDQKKAAKLGFREWKYAPQ